MTLLSQRIDPARLHRLRLVFRLAIVIKRLQLLFFLPLTIAVLHSAALQSLMHSVAVCSYTLSRKSTLSFVLKVCVVLSFCRFNL